jgi:hypothetical protein
MRFRLTLMAICGLIVSTNSGCTDSAPPPVEPTQSAQPAEKPRADDLKSFEGTWLLKSSLMVSGPGTYSQNRGEGEEQVFRIHDGVMEMRMGDDEWVKTATFALGELPECLLSSKADAAGQMRALQLRYKIEGNSLIMVQDNQYPDVLPDSFDIEGGVDRQRQINTYVRTDR